MGSSKSLSKWLPDLAFVYVDPNEIGLEKYQRNTDLTRAKRMAKKFDPFKMAPVILVRMPDGKLNALDGGHRIKTCAILGIKAPCLIMDSQGEVEDAKAFRKLNGQKKRSSYVEVMQSAIAGDVDDITLQRIIDEFGLGLSHRDEIRLRHVNQLRQCFKKYGEEAVITALDVIKDLGWKEVESRFIAGLCYMHKNLTSIEKNKNGKSISAKINSLLIIQVMRDVGFSGFSEAFRLESTRGKQVDKDFAAIICRKLNSTKSISKIAWSIGHE